MKYIEVQFITNSKKDYIKDLLAQELAEIGFESFSEEGDFFIGYVPKEAFNADQTQNIIDNFEFEKGISFSYKEAEEKNWNEEWEKNCFQPLVIDDQCVIHATFHKNVPTAQYDILIDPKMAFGTGHHSTTSLMVRFLLECDLHGKSLLDMGCGTAILAILAAKKGADPITAIDIDEWAYNNAVENIALNQTPNIEVKCGGAELLESLDTSFDIVLANINRNILLNDIHHYAKLMKSGSLLFLSGFYMEDIPVIEEECEKYGLKKSEFKMDNNWTAVKFVMV